MISLQCARLEIQGLRFKHSWGHWDVTGRKGHDHMTWCRTSSIGSRFSGTKNPQAWANYLSVFYSIEIPQILPRFLFRRCICHQSLWYLAENKFIQTELDKETLKKLRYSARGTVGFHIQCIPNIQYAIKIKSEAYSSQGNPTGQLDFCNWLADCSTTG